MPKKIQSASKQALQNKLSQLDTLGSSYSEFEDTLTASEKIAGEFIQRVQKNIDAKRMRVSGKMMDISFVPTANGFQIEAYPWLIYQDKGVNGAVLKLYDTPFSYKDKMPPVNLIKQWIEDKHIVTGRNDKHNPGKVDIDKSAAWAIAKTIYKEGQEPKDIYSKEIPKLIDDLTDAIGDVVVNTILKGI